MWSRIKNIWFKELTDSLRDKKALRQAILMPLILGIFYAFLNPLLGQIFSDRVEEQSLETATVIAIGSENVNADLAAIFESAQIELDEYSGSRAELEAEIEAGDTRLAVVIPDGFGSAIEREESAELEVLLNTGGSLFDVDVTGQRVFGAIEGYNQSLVAQRLTDRGIDPGILAPISVERVALTTPEQQAGQQASFLLPILVAVVIATGGIFVAIDVTAGEKERGTLESLLLTPATDFEIFAGKLLAVFTMTIVPLILTFIGFGISSNLVPLVFETSADSQGISPAVIIGSIFVSIPLALAVDVVLMIIAIRTKTFKDAQSAVAPVTLATMFPAMFSGFIPPSNPLLYLIPAYGTGAVAGDLAVTGLIPWVEFGFSALGCFALTAVGIFIGLRLFNRERLLYSM